MGVKLCFPLHFKQVSNAHNVLHYLFKEDACLKVRPLAEPVLCQAQLGCSNNPIAIA